MTGPARDRQAAAAAETGGGSREPAELGAHRAPIARGRADLARMPLVIGITPFGEPAPNLCVALSAAGALGVLDLGADEPRARAALAEVARAATEAFGVRVGPDCPLDPDTVRELAGDRLSTIVLDHDAAWPLRYLPADWTVLVEVVSLDEAGHAVGEGADGLIARGNEAGGRVGELSSFVLGQQVFAGCDLPVWLCGGIGEHTAAGAVVGGAAGVVLDTQLALLAESDVEPFAAGVLARADGTESVVGNGYRTVAELPIGQEAFLASRFAGRRGTVGRAVTAVRRSIRAAAGDMPEGTPAGSAFGADSPFARFLGTGLPVVQGPMTRVSDVPAFAAAVAEDGALPFLALAQASGPQAADLLTRTGAALGDRPWGVGVLGFLPDDLREAQLAAILTAHPRFALIAGGRPAQAARLEAAGIQTFLHVSSPELLAAYWDAGARRFVFEGAECGGHIGPRASFALWEAQIQVLLERAEDLSDVQVVLAGGIHDRRSAAMAWATAAALERRAAAVGILMGTAYLFTEEAVAHGAIQPEFQRQAIAADRTAVLHTAPGHASRCLPTPYVDDFARRQVELTARGVAKQEMWESLEELNVGRLRIASKALRRTGDRLEPVGTDGQRESGLFLAGQVAALRTGTTTISTLHREVTEEAARFHTGAAASIRARLGEDRDTSGRAPAPLGIAIVGMACAFPGAASLAEFWRNTVDNVDCVTEIPAGRWNHDTYFDPAAERGAGATTPSRWGGFLPPLAFDPLRYGIPPTALGAIEPAQLLALDMARRALDDAGLADGGFDRERTAVVFGAEPGGELSSAVDLRMLLPSYGPLSEAFAASLPRVTEDTFPGRLGNVISGRIANRLDLGGANFTVDAACASALAAVDVACRQLTTGDADMVLCGAVDLHNSITDFLLFSSVGALSPSGRCAAFDAEADGIALGEGAACVVLKRVADAERDGDRIYAVIDGVGAASDGRALGLVAPRPEGQRRALIRAYANARTSPGRVGLVEAHGTGTVVGDRTELEVLTDLFTEAGAETGGCALGSVKSQIGHTKCAAGLAGLIRGAMAVHTGVKPPTAHLRRPNPAWQARTSPFALHASAVPWFADPADRVAGVSAFGFGGTDFHVVLRGHASASATGVGQDVWPAELFLFRGSTVEGATRELERLAGTVRADAAQGSSLTLRDLAFTAARRADASRSPVRFAIVAEDLRELAAVLDAALAGRPHRGLAVAAGSETGEGALAVLFPGQGSQRPGMAAELLVAFPALRYLAPADHRVLKAMMPPPAFDERAAASRREALRDTRMAQPALGFADLAVFELLRKAGVVPDMVAGHSYGEVVALVAGGALDAAELAAISAARAETLVDASGSEPGSMAAVAAGAGEVKQVLAEAGLAAQVVLANLNAPRQTVVSGSSDAVAAAVLAFGQAGLTAHPLPVACAFHSPLVAGAADRFAAALTGHRVRGPALPVWSNRTAAPYPLDPEAVRAEMAAQLAAPVRFGDQVEAMYAAGARTFVEAGPGRVLSGLIDAVLRDRPHTTVACDGGLRGLLEALATLAVAGADVRLSRLLSGRDLREVGTGAPQPRPGWLLDGHAVRTADGHYLPGGYAPPRPTGEMMTADTSDRGRAVADFLHTARELVAAQRDVLLGFLGTSPESPGAVREPLAPAVQTVRELVAQPSAVAPTPVVASTVGAPPGGSGDPAAAVVAEIVARTGYPPEMIEPDLDLEADLGVDSIKRAEIAAALCRALGVDSTDSRFDDVAKRRTVRGMAEALGGVAPPDQADQADQEPDQPADALADSGARPPILPPRRFALTPAGGPRLPSDLTGSRILLLGDVPGLAHDLAARGAVVRDSCEDPDGVVFADPRDLAESFPALREAVLRGPRWLLDASGAPGVRGLFRTIAAEYPAIDVRTTAVRAEPSDLRLAATGSGPEPPGRAEARALGLDSDSVVLVIGGGRGIAARCALALTAASGCRLELAGRTVPADRAEDPSTRHAPDLRALRSALAAAGIGSPVRVDAEARSLLAQREVAATLAEAGRHGGARYRPLDVRDPAATAQLVKQVHAEHGRLDGVLFAAGVIEDRLLADKDPDSFRRVFTTKADGATALFAALDDLPEAPGFTVLFGSVAAVWGSRGQSDYAAANDALDTLAGNWAARTGNRALTVHWGPWAPVGAHPGMVSPEVARAAAARGGAVIDPAAGAEALLAELAWGPLDLRSVLYAASLPEEER